MSDQERDADVSRKVLPVFFACALLGAVVAGAIACGQAGTWAATAESERTTSQALTTTGAIYGNPDASQGITQPPGTMLSVNRLEGVRYADQFDGGATGDIGIQVNSAIADLGANGGKIFIPTGYYATSTPITIPSGPTAPHVIIEGAASMGPIATSYQGTFIVYSGSLTTPFISTSTSTTGGITYESVGTIVRNLMIHVVSSEDGGAAPSTAIDFSPGANDALIEDCTIWGTGAAETGALVQVANTVNVVVRHNSFSGGYIAIGGDTNTSTPNSNNVSVQDNAFSGFSVPPIQGIGLGWHIQGNTFEHLASGSAGAILWQSPMPGPTGLSYTANWHGDVTSGGGTWVSLTGSGLAVEGNVFSGGAVGISLNGTVGAQIAGNSFLQLQSGTALGTGVSVSGSQGTAISGNDFSGVTGGTTPFAVTLTATGGTSITGNHFANANAVSYAAYPNYPARTISFGNDWPNAGNATFSMAEGVASPDAENIAWGSGTGWKLNFGTTISGTFSPLVTMVDNGNVTVAGSLSTRVRTVTTSGTTVAGTDSIVLVSLAASGTIALPTASSATGRQVTLKATGNGTVTISPQTGEALEGGTNGSYAIAGNHAVTVTSDGTQWWVLGKY